MMISDAHPLAILMVAALGSANTSNLPLNHQAETKAQASREARLASQKASMVKKQEQIALAHERVALCAKHAIDITFLDHCKNQERILLSRIEQTGSMDAPTPVAQAKAPAQANNPAAALLQRSPALSARPQAKN